MTSTPTFSQDIIKAAEDAYAEYLSELGKIYSPAADDRARVVMDVIARAIMADRELGNRKPMDLEDGVIEFLSPYRSFISDRPELLSLLYDMDILPEQTMTLVGASRLGTLCEVWAAAERGDIKPPSPAPSIQGEG